jgi:hypothetical protein
MKKFTLFVAGILTLAGVCFGAPTPDDAYMIQLKSLTNQPTAMLEFYQSIPTNAVLERHLLYVAYELGGPPEKYYIGGDRLDPAMATNLYTLITTSPFASIPIMRRHAILYLYRMGDTVTAINQAKAAIDQGYNLRLSPTVVSGHSAQVLALFLTKVPTVSFADKADAIYKALHVPRPATHLSQELKRLIHAWNLYGNHCTLGSKQDLYRILETQYMPTFNKAAEAAWWGKNVTSKISIIAE